MGGNARHIKQITRDLEKELQKQILPDGGHISRDPATTVNLICDLLPLRQCYIGSEHGSPPALTSAIDSMMSFIRMMRHSDGHLGQFNGTGHIPASLMATILRYDTSRTTENPAPQQSAPQTGYERLSAADTVVLIDTGKPFGRTTARLAMAGTLSFELSCSQSRFVINCGIPESQRASYLPFCRTTAAHSTATIGNSSSSRFISESAFQSFLPSSLISSPENIEIKRTQQDGMEIFSASHDGYAARFGLIHHRELQLSRNGTVLNGIDRFTKSSPASHSSAPVPVSVRFHIPAGSRTNLLASGNSVLITGNKQETWTFTCIDSPLILEESIQFFSPGIPRKTSQIVLNTDSRSVSEIRWVLEKRVLTADNGKAGKGKKNPDKQLDLLREKDGTDS